MGIAYSRPPSQDLRGNGIVLLTILRHGNPVSGAAKSPPQQRVQAEEEEEKRVSARHTNAVEAGLAEMGFTNAQTF
jgi:hypothetical protein